jgi:very-short-patch-repair endonuclease
MRENNPMHRGDNLERMKATLARIGHKPRVRGGNGKGATAAEKALHAALGADWTIGHVVPTRMPKDSGYPSHYKLDPTSMVTIEVDGPSHCALARKAQDKKKADFLFGLGWITLRVSNKQVLEELPSTISRLKALIPTLPTTS